MAFKVILHFLCMLKGCVGTCAIKIGYFSLVILRHSNGKGISLSLLWKLLCKNLQGYMSLMGPKGAILLLGPSIYMPPCFLSLALACPLSHHLAILGPFRLHIIQKFLGKKLQGDWSYETDWMQTLTNPKIPRIMCPFQLLEKNVIDVNDKSVSFLNMMKPYRYWIFLKDDPNINEANSFWSHTKAWKWEHVTNMIEIINLSFEI